MSEEHFSRISSSEVDIDQFFDEYLRSLFEQRCRISDEISHWSNTIIEYIKEHATQQRKILQDEFEKQKTLLNDQRNQLLDKIRTYQKTHMSARINQLLEQCHQLKAQLAVLTYPQRIIQSIYLVTGDELKFSPPTEDQSALSSTSESLHNGIELNEIPTVKSTSHIATQTDEIASVTIKKTQGDDIFTSQNSKIRCSTRELEENCPVCLMLFPSMMSPYHRTQHVNEHYTDD